MAWHTLLQTDWHGITRTLQQIDWHGMAWHGTHYNILTGMAWHGAHTLQQTDWYDMTHTHITTD